MTSNKSSRNPYVRCDYSKFDVCRQCDILYPKHTVVRCPKCHINVRTTVRNLSRKAEKRRDETVHRY